MRVGSPLMTNVLTRIARSVLIPSGLTARASATDTTIQKKIYQSGMTKLTISNKEMDVNMKIVKSLKESGLFKKVVSKTIKNETKEQTSGSPRWFFSTLGASLLGSLLVGKGVIQAGEETI